MLKESQPARLTGPPMVSNRVISAPPLPPLYKRVPLKYPVHRFLDVTVLSLLLAILFFRLKSFDHGFAWILGFLCESCFTFVWVITISTKWTPVQHITYPENLPKWVEELPPVDVFVATADPVLEPPIITVNTVLSVLALDYPAQKIACYVSDDGCSAHTFYSIVEAVKYAKLWVPFCHKYNIHVRAPFRYFSGESTSSTDHHLSSEFQQDWKNMKDGYEELIRKIDDFSKESISIDLDISSNLERRNHASIVKVIWENKGDEGANALSHLVYVSREKRPKHPHHYKAGAMNALTRVSGVMTNAPFILNLDCDMYVNNPQILRHAMCLLLGCKQENGQELGFLQSPQYFYNSPDSALVVLQKYLGNGVAGIQGPMYVGTGCFHWRKIMYGLHPPGHKRNDHQAKTLTSANGSLNDKKQLQLFGNSKKLIKSAADALQGKSYTPKSISSLIETAISVANCSFESGTGWGNEIGWQYGSTAEDTLTGLLIHSRGWTSAYCQPDPLPFLGLTPLDLPSIMTQQKRWATGLLEILFSRKSPIVAYFTTKLRFRMCLAYNMILIWGIRSIPELLYALLPAYSIITNSSFLPKWGEAALYIYVALFVTYNLYTLSEYLETGMSVQSWLTQQIGARIVSVNGFLFGVFSVIFKFLGISESVFEVTQKTSFSSGDDQEEQPTFDGSPVFVPGTTLVLVHFTALVMACLGWRSSARDGGGSGVEEVVGSAMVVLCFWPFVQGMFRRGKHGIPLGTMCISSLLALVFVRLCTKIYGGTNASIQTQG